MCTTVRHFMFIISDFIIEDRNIVGTANIRITPI